MYKTLENLKGDLNVYGIYNVGPPVFNVEGDDFYIVIIDNDAEDFILDESIKGIIYTMKTWFELIESCDILPYICAFLNKKYVIKEYVKIMMETNPLKMRLSAQKECYVFATNCPEALGEMYARIALYNQILEHHKIVNYKVVGAVYKAFLDASSDNLTKVSEKFYKPELEAFLKATDGVYKKYKIAKWEQNKNKENDNKTV